MHGLGVARPGKRCDVRQRELDVAVSLMRMALALLDRVGDTLTAARLQHAIDTAERRGLGPPTADEIEKFMIRQDR